MTLRFRLSTAAAVLLMLSAAAVAIVPTASAATGTICDQYGTTTQGNYVVMNNRWGTTATQCINVTTSGFQIIQQDGTGNLSGAPVSYPAIYIGCHYANCSPSSPLPMQISAISSANTSVTTTYPSSGTFDAAYDIWINADTNVTGVQDTEIMIWLNHTGSTQPVGSNTGATFSAAGRSWAVWVGNNGGNNVVSYVQAGITSFNVDAMLFIRDAITRGSGFGTSSWYLTSIQMGFEPWIGGVGLAVNSFSATISGGGGGATPTPVRTATATPRTSATPVRTATATPRTSATPVRTATATPQTSATPVRTATATPQTSATPVRTATPAPSGAARCSATLRVDNQWGNGFTATVTVSNPGSVATKTWRVTWTWGGNQSISSRWNATVTQSGTAVTATNLSYNGAIAGGGNTTFGLQAGFSGTNTVPTLTCSAT
jgi:Glycosyl hydrolase family 12/Cellulose binding domain